MATGVVRAEQAAEAIEELLESVSLYLHIPFCTAKCHYCDFNSYAGMLGLRGEYVSALCVEIREAGQRAQRGDGRPRRCRTIFLGGGTPSLLHADAVRWLLDAVHEAFAVDADAEVTLEANPGTLEQGNLEGFRAAGVTRLSMGAQSFDAGLLRWMGRIHTPEAIELAVGAARRAGFTSINLDFIYALPQQTMAQWRETLERALHLRPEHLSLYSLIVEEGTPLYTWVARGSVTPADEDLAAEMYEYAGERLASAGYAGYEISNWALPGHQCQHNLTYWHNLPYLGLGAGAHSWYAGHRFAEVRPVRRYIEQVHARAPGTLPALAIGEDEAIPTSTQMVETAMLGLRLHAGLDLQTFARRFGCAFEQVFGERLAEMHTLGLLEASGHSLRLTPRGRLLGNEVFQRLLLDAPETA